MRPLRALFDILDQHKDNGENFQPMPLSQHDILESIKTTKSSSDEGLRKKYDEWQASFGSV
jgi:hypothetical protein